MSGSSHGPVGTMAMRLELKTRYICSVPEVLSM